MRELVHFGLDAFDAVCGAVDDGLEQAHQHALARGAGDVALLRAGQVQLHAARLAVAHGDEAIGREHERDGRGDIGLVTARAAAVVAALLRLRQRQDDGRHDVSAGFLVDAAGGLDLRHLLARRHEDAQRLLHPRVFLARGMEQVDPDGGGRDAAVGPASHEHAVHVIVNRNHGGSPRVRRSALAMPNGASRGKQDLCRAHVTGRSGSPGSPGAMRQGQNSPNSPITARPTSTPRATAGMPMPRRRLAQSLSCS